MRISRLAAPVVACLVASLALPLSVATAGTRTAGTPAAAPAAPATGPVQHVLLGLTPSDRGSLQALARSGSNPRSAPAAAALHRALPGAARQQSVADIARSLGLTVERTTTMAVLVSGRASLVQSLFGSARAVDPTSKVQHPLPFVPPALRGLVTVALGGDDSRPAFRHFALNTGTADGGDFRTAYGNTVRDPLTPPTAAERAGTIATVQLSGWHASDLDDYADFLRSSAATGDPRWPAPRYSAVRDPFIPPCVSTSDNDTRCDNFFGDDVEVALDQEAIYATAPYARQRAYLSGNDLLGMVDSLTAIGDDASDPNVDRHLVAASISWGICETDLAGTKSGDALLSLLEDTLSYTLATGVTVFAASGDGGGQCDGLHRGVSYPASSPQVVAVGGTEHSGDVATTPAEGWRYSEGGESIVFPQPSYQHATATGSTMRTVPDLATLGGDPGFAVLTSSPYVTSGSPKLVKLFGTSLASPIAATGYAVEVARHGYSWGVGDILPGLYRQPASFTDVDDGCTKLVPDDCSGWTGADVARTGYDEVTGLGTPDWSALVGPALGGDPHLSVNSAFSGSRQVPVTVHVPDWQSYDRYRIDVDSSRVCTVNGGSTTVPTSVTIDDDGSADGVHELTLVAWNSTASPVVCHYSDSFVLVDTDAPSARARLTVRRADKNLVAHWGGSDDFGSGIAEFSVRLGYPGRTVVSTSRTHRGSIAVTAKPGKIYTLSITTTDRAGNSRTATAQAADDQAFSFRGHWAQRRVHAALGGSEATTSATGARTGVQLTGRDGWLYVTTCPSCGKLAVVIDGGNAHIFDTYSAKTRHAVALPIFSSSRSLERHVVIRATGKKSRHSDGDAVRVDAVATGA